MMKTVFIDGSAGTTGLRISERLSSRTDLTLLALPEEQRKDTAARARALNEADIAILCLPDAAAQEAVSLMKNPDTVVQDTSTAHRTAPGWVYGFPELSPAHAAAIRTAKRIAVPGCHASGFIALTAPLRAAGILPAGTLLSCFSLTGYSGGGGLYHQSGQGRPADRDQKASCGRHGASGDLQQRQRQHLQCKRRWIFTVRCTCFTACMTARWRKRRFFYSLRATRTALLPAWEPSDSLCRTF